MSDDDRLALMESLRPDAVETGDEFQRIGLFIDGALFYVSIGSKDDVLRLATIAQTRLDRLVLKLQEERCAR